MMKNILLKITGLLLVALVLLSASKPSIEGRAAVADVGELPPGMYIKAHNFLPGDTVIITNPSTKVSVEVFVFESIDEGVAAIVSSEVAEKLFITANTDTIVQIRKVVVSTEIAEADLGIVDTPIVVSEVSPSSQEVLDDSTEFNPDSLDKSIAEEDVLIDNLAIISSEPVIEEIPVEEPIEQTLSVEDTVEEIAFTDIIVPSNEELETPSEIEDTDAVVFTPFSDMSSLFSTTYPSETSSTEPVAEIPEVAIEDESTSTDIIEVTPLVEPIVVIDESQVQEEIEVIEETIAENIIEDASPNILIPTDENPAVALVEEPQVSLEPSYIEQSVAVVAEETIDIFALTPATEYVEEVPVFSGQMSDYIVDSITVEGTKKYYVQLATYKDSGNINTVLQNYSEKYPLALVESNIIANAYQVFVGPLTKDEYTVVLERFKTYGYKDAFLKIAN